MLMSLGKKRKKTFQLTPEAKLIADNFKANKGRLPWPLEKGVVVQGFGRQRHPVVKTTTIQSNGVILATEPFGDRLPFNIIRCPFFLIGLLNCIIIF